MSSSNDQQSIVIIGGGVAGMACALWLKNLGYVPVIVERNNHLGGQLRQINRVNRWVLGLPEKTSAELAEIYAAHIDAEAIAVIYQAQIISIIKQSTGFDLQIEATGKPQLQSAKAIVIATGVRVLGVESLGAIPGLKSLSDAKLISAFPLSHIDELPGLAGKAVAVIGGGDNAHYTANDLVLAGAKVYLLIRSHQKARATIRKQVENYIKQGSIIEIIGTQVTGFRRDMEKIEIEFRNSNNTDGRILVDTVFVRLGFAANSEFVDNFVSISGIARESGYIATDSAKLSNIPLVYAIGDVSSRNHQSVVCAISDGAIAAQAISERVSP
jgi:thioredoxin reductase (NADPH)